MHAGDPELPFPGLTRHAVSEGGEETPGHMSDLR
jgi:hypothetical protein